MGLDINMLIEKLFLEASMKRWDIKPSSIPKYGI